MDNLDARIQRDGIAGFAERVGACTKGPGDAAYERQVAIEETTERAIVASLSSLVEIAAPLWHLGDGDGGWVIRTLMEIAEDRGIRPPPIPKRPSRRRSVPAQERLRILRRDRYECQRCASRNDLEIDHIIAVANGGSNEPDNLQVLCHDCNAHKGTS